MENFLLIHQCNIATANEADQCHRDQYTLYFSIANARASFFLFIITFPYAAYEAYVQSNVLLGVAPFVLALLPLLFMFLGKQQIALAKGALDIKDEKTKKEARALAIEKYNVYWSLWHWSASFAVAILHWCINKKFSMNPLFQSTAGLF
jgi:hypothetical protein